ncbi:MAG: hypothetical protein Q4D29_05830 [Lachnospiraceae bacterium]|nr:hypothetical protein [Lachnospiraceae bacterium]
MRKRFHVMKELIFLSLMSIMIITCTIETKAGYESVTPTYRTYDYNNYLSYEARMSTMGYYMHTIYVDLSKMDTLRIPHVMAVRRCCSNTNIIEPVFVKLKINGTTVYYDDTYEVHDSVLSALYEDTVIDITGYRSKNAKVDYEIQCGVVNCRNCGARTEAQCMYSGLYFTDLRPKANIKRPNLTLNQGESFTYTPDLLGNTARVAWGIRYNSNSGFTLLNDGAYGNGLTISGANSPNMTISNVPLINGGFDIGLFVYNADGDLPGGTEFPNTPFVSHVNVIDKVSPTMDIKKTYDTEKKCVVIEIIGNDNVGLHSTPYSFDGGTTYSEINKKAFREPGKIVVVLRDTSGNIVRKDIYIDEIDIEKVRPRDGGTNGSLVNKEPASGNGEATSGSIIDDVPDIGSGSTSESGGEDSKVEKPADNKPIENKPAVDQIKDDHIDKKPEEDTVKDKPNTLEEKRPSEKIDTNNIEPGTDKFNNIKDIEKELIQSKNVSDTLNERPTTKVKNKTENELISQNGNQKSTSNNKSGNKSNLKPSDISDENAEDAFERIRNNSEKYIIKMRENKKTEEKLAPKEEATINLKNIENELQTYEDDGNNKDNFYTPGRNNKVAFYISLCAAVALIIILLLVFILFFGVLIYADKETELSMLSDTQGIKLPVAICFICFSKNGKSVNIRELLNKYGYVYARFGLLFTYLYDGEKIRIMTKTKREKKIEIATEVIHKEIIIGNK